MMLNLNDMWIKAAVEHRKLSIDYEDDTLIVEPDSVKGSTAWAGEKRFDMGKITRYYPTTKTFIPPTSKWRLLVDEYIKKKLNEKKFLV